MIGRYEQAELDQDLRRQRRLLAATRVAETLYAQIYFPAHGTGDHAYAEENSRKLLLAPNEWQPVTWEVTRPQDLRTGRLRLDLLNTRGTVSISSIKLAHAVTGEVYWAAQDREQFSTCVVEGDGLVLPDEKMLTIVCTGDDARLRLPLLPDLPDCPIYLKVWIKPSRKQAILGQAWTRLNDEASTLKQSLEEKQAAIVQTQAQVTELKRQLDENVAAQHDKKQELEALLKQDNSQRNQIETLLQKQKAAEQSLQSLEKDLQAKAAEVATQRQHIEALKQRIKRQGGRFKGPG